MHRKLINVYNTEFLFESNYFYAILSNLKVLQNFCRIIDTISPRSSRNKTIKI